MAASNRKLRVAFVVGTFPATTETFIINQIADLIDMGVEVEVFSFARGTSEAISSRYHQYRMATLTHYLSMPGGYLRMLGHAIPKVVRGLLVDPHKLLHLIRGGTTTPTYVSRNLFLAGPFLGRHFDVIHCHFGTVANRYLAIRALLGDRTRMVTTFYGYDVSSVLRTEASEYYDELKRECDLFFVMSKDMRDRVVGAGFDERKTVVLPVSIDVASYPYRERQLVSGEPVTVVSVGRFVEKKGFDDVIRAIEIVKRRVSTPFKTYLVGGGPQEEHLRKMVTGLGLDDVIEFKPFLPVEQVIDLCMNAQLFLQPSKIASDGDME